MTLPPMVAYRRVSDQVRRSSLSQPRAQAWRGAMFARVVGAVSSTFMSHNQSLYC